MKNLSSILAGCAVALAPVLLGLPGFTVLVVGLAFFAVSFFRRHDPLEYWQRREYALAFVFTLVVFFSLYILPGLIHSN